MNGILNVATKIVAFADSTASSNPRQRFFDWTRDISGTPAKDPKSEGHQIEPLATKVIFDGTRSTTIDGTTSFSLALLPVDGAIRYRVSHTAGTAPGLRTPRNLTPNGMELVFAVNANATVTLTSDAPLFGAVQPGDGVFIPHTTTGDVANVISAVNAGYWQALAVTSSQNITLVRLAGEDFSAVAETVTLTADSQLRAYGPTGVQTGDSVDINAGFSATTQKTYEVTAVTDLFFEIVSTVPLPNETSIEPGALGMVFYTETKQFLYLEAQQECVVRVNGDTGNSQRVSPVEPGDGQKPGFYMRRGPTWALTVVNRSTSPLDVTVIHSE